MNISTMSKRDLICAELNWATRGYTWDASSGCATAIVEWHMRAIATARAEPWIPGMARNKSPVVEAVLSRFYAHHIKTTIARLTDENIELKLRLLDAIACIDFYAIGGADVGHRAAETLRKLRGVANTARQDEAVTNSKWSQRDRMITAPAQ